VRTAVIRMAKPPPPAPEQNKNPRATRVLACPGITDEIAKENNKLPLSSLDRLYFAVNDFILKIDWMNRG
jgi:hypothetical protein